MGATDCVEFATTAGSVSMTRGWTATLANHSFFLRVKVPVLTGTFAPIHDIEGGGNFSVYMDIIPSVSGIGDINVFDGGASTTIRAASNGVWIDIGARPSGSNTDYYVKLASSGSWPGSPVSVARPSMTPSDAYFGKWPALSGSDTGVIRYGKIVLWDTAKSVGAVQGETAGRSLQDSANVWFYNDCTLAGSSVGTDNSGAGHNFTVTGTPTLQADDPGFPAGGGSSVPRHPFGASSTPGIGDLLPSNWVRRRAYSYRGHAAVML
jgi:hypothetical protein